MKSRKGFEPKLGQVEPRKESPKIVLRTMTPGELENLVHDDRKILHDRFMRSDEGGAFKYFFPEDLFNSKLNTKIVYSVIQADGQIVGIGKLTERSDEEKSYELSSVSIDPKYQGRGYASRLLDEMFRYAKERGFRLVNSYYSKEGKEKLQNVLAKLAEKHGVEFADEKTVLDWD